MRGPFDTTCDIWSGPLAFPALTLKASNVPCRFVPETRILPTGKFLKMRTAHLTLDALQPVGALFVHGPPLYTVDAGYADRVFIPSGSGNKYGILWVETITPSVLTTYYRCHLVPLPDPDGEY